MLEVELPEGLENIKEHAFYECKSLLRMKVPSSIKVIGYSAFSFCECLVEVKLCEGLERIGGSAFSECKSLRCISLPSTVREVGNNAFDNCKQLDVLELCDGLEQIDACAFRECKSLKLLIVPSTVKKICEDAFFDCTQLASVELYDGLEQIERSTFKLCFSLRNVAIPTGAQAAQCFGFGCYDLLKLFGSQEMIYNALKSRFDGLPIHKLCYCQSYDVNDTTIEQIDDIIDPMPALCPLGEVKRSNKSITPDQLLNKQDCLGMTPLHIVACSTKQNLYLYQFIVANQSDSLILQRTNGAALRSFTQFGAKLPRRSYNFWLIFRSPPSRTTFWIGIQ